MTGILWAIVAGVGFGVFQIINRKAGVAMDVFRATFILLFVSAVILAGVSIASQDLGLLRSAPLLSVVYFGLAGLIHFFVGWTLLSVSQKRVGAARTGALMGATPLFATAIAALALNEYLDLSTIGGILLVVAGVYMVSNG